MALVSQPRRGRLGSGYSVYSVRRRRRRGPYVAAGLLVVLVVVVVAGAVVVASAGASLTSDPSALARVGMPLGGGTVESVSVLGGPTSRTIPVVVRGERIWPRVAIPAGERVSIEAVVKRPGWISWLAGSTTLVHETLTTPAAAPARTYVTLGAGAPLRLSFTRSVTAVFYGPASSQLTRHLLAAASTEVTLPRSGAAGTVWVAGTPRPWETAAPVAVSWFPAGAASAAVASPAPGTRISPTTPISLTFSKPVSAALHGTLPQVSPSGSGSWQQISSHTLVFRPTAWGYGLGAVVKVGLPAGVRMPGATGGPATWTVAAGSTVRLQQLLATLGYLPVNFNSSASVPSTPAAQEAAAIHPPAGSFSWRWGSIPGQLRTMWQPGAFGPITKGAVMAFENNQGMAPDGVAGPVVWKALINAALKNQTSSFGYSFVAVDEASQSLNLWHNGQTILTTPVNTGVAGAPTAKGTFNVFEHIPSGTMSGTNADGSHYVDPGIPWISYFNGGDALHGFVRASYGTPQSNGCVEMPIPTAGRVYPYTPIGTIVNVS